MDIQHSALTTHAPCSETRSMALPLHGVSTLVKGLRYRCDAAVNLQTQQSISGSVPCPAGVHSCLAIVLNSQRT